jgi:hypothetical protein
MGMLDDIRSLALKFQGQKINNAPAQVLLAIFPNHKVSALNCESINMIPHYLLLMKLPYCSN